MTAAEAPKTARRGVQVHATIDPDFFDVLEDHRWTVRLNMVDLVKLALTRYAVEEGLIEAETPAPEAAAKVAPKA